MPASVLNVGLSLTSGQVFRWDQNAAGDWSGVVGDTAVLIRPEQTGFWWATHPPGRWDVLQSFFALDVDLEVLYGAWKQADSLFAELIERYRGLRVLRQPPASALISFICSSCNNVPRISRLVRALAAWIADPIDATWPGCTHADPTLPDLASVREDDLRDAGFGYRARYLAELGGLVGQGAVPDLDALRAEEWVRARSILRALPGVGAKVADCVGLFGMGHDDVVPVDTHVRRWVVTRHRPDLAGCALTPRVYDALAGEFRGIMGPYAGWAQQYVFMAARGGFLA